MRSHIRLLTVALALICVPTLMAQSLNAQVASARNWAEHRKIIELALKEDHHVELEQAYAKARAKEDSLDLQSGHALALARWCNLNSFGGPEPRRFPSENVTSLIEVLRKRRREEHTTHSLLAQYALDVANPSLEIEQTKTQDLVETWADGSKHVVQAMVIGGLNEEKKLRLYNLAMAALNKSPGDPEARYYVALFESDPQKRLTKLLGAYGTDPGRMSLFGLQQITLAAVKAGDGLTAAKTRATIQSRLGSGGMWESFFLRSYPEYRKS